MADGRHFEHSFIAISQSEFIRFRRNLVRRCRLCFQGRLLNKIPIFCKFKMADGRHIENRLLAISRRMITRLTRNLYKAESRSNTVHMTKIPNFENSRWRTAAILKMVLSLYLSRKSSDLNEIWCADADCASKVGYLKMLKFCKFKMADGRHIENHLLAISQ